jgi:hypothetical protein
LLVDFISFLPSSCYDDISVIVDNYYGSLRFGKYLDELGIPFVFTREKIELEIYLNAHSQMKETDVGNLFVSVQQMM